MSDENINPQNIPVQVPDTNLPDQKSSSLNLKKNILIIIVIVLFIVVSVSLYVVFLRPSNPRFFPPEPVPTITPKATDVPSSTLETGEYIITIKLEETIIIPNTSISLAYSSADIPGDNCYDCIASNTLEVKNDGQTKKLEYSCGGFSGECITKQDAFGYQVELLEQTSKDSLRLKIKKQ